MKSSVPIPLQAHTFCLNDLNWWQNEAPGRHESWSYLAVRAVKRGHWFGRGLVSSSECNRVNDLAIMHSCTQTQTQLTNTTQGCTLRSGLGHRICTPASTNNFLGLEGGGGEGAPQNGHLFEICGEKCPHGGQVMAVHGPGLHCRSLLHATGASCQMAVTMSLDEGLYSKWGVSPSGPRLCLSSAQTPG